MADMMPKQVITLHHFDRNIEDRAQNFRDTLFHQLYGWPFLPRSCNRQWMPQQNPQCKPHLQAHWFFILGSLWRVFLLPLGSQNQGSDFWTPISNGWWRYALCLDVWDRFSLSLASKAYPWRTLLSLHRFNQWHPKFWGPSFLMSASPFWRGLQCWSDQLVLRLCFWTSCPKCVSDTSTWSLGC